MKLLDFNEMKASSHGEPVFKYEGTVLSLVGWRVGGSPFKDTVSLPVGRILRPVTCELGKRPTSTHRCEFTGFKERKLMSSGMFMEVKVVVDSQRE